MALGILKSVIDYHDHFLDSYGDPRTKDWWLMGSIFPTVALSLVYVYIVKYLGPQLMKNREPYTLKHAMIAYNGLLVCWNCWGLYKVFTLCWLNGYSLRCQPCDFSNSPTALRVASFVWVYYFSKFIEFFDTFFFVLRKKDKQVSTLHVFHHAIMPISTWTGVRFYPGGHVVFFGTFNTFVHSIMYTYYFLTALGPEFQKYLWWKKYLTTLQLVQFVGCFCHSIQLFFIDCPEVPIAFAWAIVGHAVLFFILFLQFYNEAYVAGEKSKTSTAIGKMNMCMPTSPDADELKNQ